MNKIMFNDQYHLTQAVLEGRKTMTRRDEMDCNLRFYLNEYENSRIIIEGDQICIYSDDGYLLANKPTRYKVGEVVAIAQPYKDILDYLPEGYRRKSDGWISDFISTSVGLNNKMFVRANLMPKHIKITGIRCERLQDISNEDCLKEGIQKWENVKNVKDVAKYGGYTNGSWDYFTTPTEAFATLIDKVSGKGIWERNPLIIVYEFELIK